MLEDIKIRVEKAIGEKVFPGCVIGVVRDNGERIIIPLGTTIYGSAGEIITEDTVYDLASVTKSIPVASLVSTFLVEGKCTLTDAIKSYLPELQNDHGATIEDLLSYRVQGTQLSTLDHKTFEEIRTHVFEYGFIGPSGNRVYTNLPAFLLGMIVERVGGASLGALAHKRFFEPLEMNATTFFPTPSLCAPTEIDDRGEVRGLPHDESAYVFAKERRAVGHAGLFSTAPDILNFLESLLREQYPHIILDAQQGLGWQLRDHMSMGKFAGPQTFGKTGFTGTSVVVDIGRGIGFVILSNRTYPKRPADSTAINTFRADIADILLR